MGIDNIFTRIGTNILHSLGLMPFIYEEDGSHSFTDAMNIIINLANKYMNIDIESNEQIINVGSIPIIRNGSIFGIISSCFSNDQIDSIMLQADDLGYWLLHINAARRGEFFGRIDLNTHYKTNGGTTVKVVYQFCYSQIEGNFTYSFSPADPDVPIEEYEKANTWVSLM
jgi:hypothetical protein